MTRRSKDQRDQDRADLVAVLTENGPTMTGDLIAAAHGLTEVMTGSPIHTQAMVDLRALERARVIRWVWVDACFGGYELATADIVAADDDLAEVARLEARWEPAPPSETTAVERVEAMVAAGEVRLCRQTGPISEKTAQVLVDFADELRTRGPRP